MISVVAGVLGLVYLGVTAAPGVPVIPPTEGMTAGEVRGLDVFNANSCAVCHSVRGLGGSQGPDLSRAGARWSESRLREGVISSEDMPTYDHLASQQLDDLVEYLMSLR